MKVVTAAQMRHIDSYTIDEIGISGIVLMETAGSQIVRKIEHNVSAYLSEKGTMAEMV